MEFDFEFAKEFYAFDNFLKLDFKISQNNNKLKIKHIQNIKIPKVYFLFLLFLCFIYIYLAF